ncbi:MAG TPA: DMT family transporter [Beijerinckiaceae bacterium]|nr:DMT family transporter [Beijerinckiaceae bacterium]
MDPSRARIVGIGLMCLGISMFALNDAMGKWLLASYSVGQLLVVRSVAALTVLTPAMLSEGRALLHPPHPGLQAVRVALSTVEVAMFYWAVSVMPLAETTTFWLAVPIYVAVLAGPMLGERIPLRRWVAILVGFGGVVLAVNPGGAGLGWPVLIAFSGSLAFAFMMIVTRHLRGTSDTTLVAWQTLAALIGGLALLPFEGWKPTGWRDLVLLSILGVIAMLAHVATNRSLKLAPASVVVPYQYTIIVWAVTIGWLVFGDVPAMTTIIGALIIIAAGVWIFWDEARAGQEALAETEEIKW